MQTADRRAAEPRMSAPANIFAQRFDPVPLRRDARTGSAVASEIGGMHSSLTSWVNFPLINSSGSPYDLDLRNTRKQKETVYAIQMPAAMAIVEWLRFQGFHVQHARIAVLFSRDLLRPHVDMHQSVRLLVQLNDQGNNFRHVFGNYCIAMKAGELWGVDGSICHGAANLSQAEDRVMLIVDCDPAPDGVPWTRRSTAGRPRPAPGRSRVPTRPRRAQSSAASSRFP